MLPETINLPELFGSTDFYSERVVLAVRTNLDNVDRIIRGVAGVRLILVAVSAFRVRRRVTAVIAGIAGVGPVRNAATGYCGGNSLVGIDTANGDDDARGQS